MRTYTVEREDTVFYHKNIKQSAHYVAYALYGRSLFF